MHRPTFSIITPTYNRAYVLWKLIQGIQHQTFTNWEFLIVDDGSTDDTNKLIAEFQGDERIKYIVQKNQGPSAARNTGLSHSQGHIIVYMDSDDEPYKHFLSTIYSFLNRDEKKSFGVCNHNRSIELLGPNFKTISHKVDSATQNHSVTLQHFYNWEIKTTGSGLFHRRDKFFNKIEWKKDIYIEDLEFIMQLAMLDEEGFLHITQSLFHYRQKYGGDGLCSKANYLNYAHAFGQIYEWHKNDPLMKKPEVYLDRVKKYQEQHRKYLLGEEIPPIYKYFPEQNSNVRVESPYP
jgi:glycosyltransferase involved in cell wall biosynthesis